MKFLLIFTFLLLIVNPTSANYEKMEWYDLSDWDIHIGNGTNYTGNEELRIYKGFEGQDDMAYIQTHDSWEVFRNVSFSLTMIHNTWLAYTHKFEIFGNDTGPNVSIIINHGEEVIVGYDGGYVGTAFIERNVTYTISSILNRTGLYVSILNQTGEQNLSINFTIDKNLTGYFKIIAAFASSADSCPFDFLFDNLTIQIPNPDPIPDPPLGQLDILSHIWNITNTTASLTTFLNDTANYSANRPGTWSGANPYHWDADTLQPNTTYNFSFYFWNETSETWLNITDTTLADPEPDPPPYWEPVIHRLGYNVSITDAYIALRSNESVHAGWTLEGGPGNAVSEHIVNDFTFRMSDLTPETDYWLNITFTNAVNGSTQYDWDFATGEVPINRWDPQLISARVLGVEPHSVSVEFVTNESTWMDILTPIDRVYGLIYHPIHPISFLNLTPDMNYTITVRFTNGAYGNITYNMTFATIAEPEAESDDGDETSLIPIIAMVAIILIAIIAVPLFRPKRRRSVVWNKPPPEPDIPELEEFEMKNPTLPWVGGTDKLFFPEAPSVTPDKTAPSLAIQIATVEDLVTIITRLKDDAQMDVCEENQQVLRNVKDVEKRLRQLRDDRDIAPRKYEQMLREVKDLRKALENLTPLMKRRKWDV